MRTSREPDFRFNTPNTGKGVTHKQLEQLVTINLFGQPYTFRAETECVNPSEVANCLMEEIRKVESHKSGKEGELSKFMMLLLAALNIANQNVKLKKDLEELTEMVNKRSDKLSDHLDMNVRRLSGIPSST